MPNHYMKKQKETHPKASGIANTKKKHFLIKPEPHLSCCCCATRNTLSSLKQGLNTNEE